jgi:protein-S-isoprenylcysteine O-methyltransferase Ste14
LFPEWSSSAKAISTTVGVFMLGAGFILAGAGTVQLGRNLTPFICPKADAVLLAKGAYRLVRHPIYSGLLLMSFGWGLWVHGWLTLCYAVLLFLIFDIKSRKEEVFLIQKFPGYLAYSRRIKRLIPFMY